MIPNDAIPTGELTKNGRDDRSTKEIADQDNRQEPTSPGRSEGQAACSTGTDKKVVNYTTSEKVYAANRKNTLKSTGPRTVKGKAASRLNAVKHGILSTEVVVRGLRIQERADEFRALRERCWESLAPVGPMEEMLVDTIVSTQWRLRRVLMAETGEIVLSVDGGLRRRADLQPLPLGIFLDQMRDAAYQMEKSAQGVVYLKTVLGLLQTEVEREGELTQGIYDQFLRRFVNTPNYLTEDLWKFRKTFLANAAGLSPEELKETHRREVLQYIGGRLACFEQLNDQNVDREEKEETAQQLANVLPAAAVLDKILRYQNALERQLYRAMNQLERLQRRREGEEVPPPVTMQLARG